MSRSVLTFCISFAAASGALLPLTTAQAAAPTPKDLEFFEKKVRPLMATHCLECHSGDEPEGQLSMESLGGLLTGGLRGPALVPGKPCLLYTSPSPRDGLLSRMPSSA